MIYISSFCIKAKTVRESIERLASLGYRRIELSGGMAKEEDMTRTLLSLKKDFGVDLICHNYFPPPPENFVLNLASLDDGIFRKSVDHFKKAVELSQQLEAPVFGLHAGFFMDIPVEQIGKQIKLQKLYDQQACFDRFCKGFEEIKRRSGKIKLYVENNVLSATNYKEFGGVNPLMLTSFADYIELKKRLDFELLLDVGHLKVSAQTFNFNFQKELKNFWPQSDYIHISDNDGLGDSNQGLLLNSDLVLFLRENSLKNKVLTLEMRIDEASLKTSYLILEKLI